MADVLSQSQFVREAPEIEAQKLGLLESAKAQVEATQANAAAGNYLTPNYQIAGMTQNQMDAIRGGETGIGAYQPYLSNAAQQLVGGQQTTGSAVDVLRGADDQIKHDHQRSKRQPRQQQAAAASLGRVGSSGVASSVRASRHDGP